MPAEEDVEAKNSWFTGIFLRVLLKIEREWFSGCLSRDSNSGCGRQNNAAEWPTLQARRSVIRLI
jgi:hypothetical protein